MLASLAETITDKINHNEGHFVLTLSQPHPFTNNTAFSEKKHVLRILQKNSDTYIQEQYYTDTQHFSEKPLPYTPDTLSTVLQKILDKPYKRVHLQTPSADFFAKVTLKAGTQKILTTTSKPSITQWNSVQHDKNKQYPITPDNSQNLLYALGITDNQQRIIPSRRDKYTQINHFISIIQTLDCLTNPPSELTIVDCGCGKAYLSLALYHYLTSTYSMTVHLHGIDTNTSVIDFCRVTVENLAYNTVFFHNTTIADAPLDSVNANIVIALHACDTATDDALAFAVQKNAQAIVAAPCCHNYVNSMLSKNSVPDNAALLVQDGITRERLADLLTDSMRRDILIGFGYSAKLIEFISPEHTLKNIMIRAEKKSHAFAPDFAAFHTQRTLWNVAPKLAELLDV
jgi:hypothetical protein